MNVNVGLLIIGDEILSGRREDKHLPKVIELLAARGMALSWARYCGDEPARITADLRDALASGDLVFSCGGIGATPDDHTRQCAAEASGRPLEMHPVAGQLILERIRAMAEEKGEAFDPDRDHTHRLNMGVFPSGAEIVPNPFNKIPGFSLRGPSGKGGVYFLPGFPVMAWPMIEWVLDEHWAALHRTQRQHERSVIVFGAMEASLTPLMLEIEARFPGVKVFSLPSVDHPEWGKHIDLGVKGLVASEVTAAYAAMREGLLSRSIPLGPEKVR